ncbi:MAG TPA: hypothetical protein VFD83_01020, partial [Candidatus Polarisedimenticolia bacterium]|nr:hypothetical protein [Candidatus Polarisedimenticolia bacterium]
MTETPKKGRKAKTFFATALEALAGSSIPFLVGGGYALRRHAHLKRPARDLDVFVMPDDTKRVLRLFADLGYRVELTFPHWLGKIYRGRQYVDIIFSSGNGVATVDGAWFQHATDDIVLGQRVRLCPPEEMIWSKAFVMERERYDGADVNHLILACGEDMDWPRLLTRFESYRLVLLSHLVLFLFVYPSEASRVPAWVWDELRADLEVERRASHSAPRICRGTFLSRGQYLDALARGYHDARLLPEGTMSPEDVV